MIFANGSLDAQGLASYHGGDRSSVSFTLDDIVLVQDPDPEPEADSSNESTSSDDSNSDDTNNSSENEDTGTTGSSSSDDDGAYELYLTSFVGLLGILLFVPY